MLVSLFVLSACLAGCSSTPSSTTAPAAPSNPVSSTKDYSVGVSVSGLTGSSVVLQLNGGANLTLSANGTGTFSTELASGSSYQVTVLSQPADPPQACAVQNGSGTIGSADVTSVAVQCQFDLRTTTANVSLASSVPNNVAGMITTVNSPADQEPLSGSLLIPINANITQVPVFASDSNGNLLLASYTGGGATTLSAESTATTLVLVALGPTLGFSNPPVSLVQAIQSAGGYATLVSDLTKALGNGTAPLQSTTVVQDMITVINQSSVSYPVQQARSGAIHAMTALPLPTKLVGPLSTTVQAVYVTGPAGNGVAVANSMPITWVASSTDTAAHSLDPGETVDGINPLLSLLTPTTKTVNGNGQDFVLTVAQTDDTRLANQKLVLADLVGLLVSTSLGVKYSSLNSCAQEAANAMVQQIPAATIQSVLAAPSGNAAAAYFAGSFTATILFNGLRSATNCSLGSTTVLKLLANLSGWASGLNEIWAAVNLGYATVIPATDAGLTYGYFRASASAEFCESGGILTMCDVVHYGQQTAPIQNYSNTPLSIQWNTPFADANYAAVCGVTIDRAFAYLPITVPTPEIVTKTDSGLTATIPTDSGSSFNATLSCLAVPDKAAGGISVAHGAYAANQTGPPAPVTMMWNKPFPDASYLAVCSAIGTDGLQNAAVFVSVTQQTVSQITVQVESGYSGLPGNVDCLGAEASNGVLGTATGTMRSSNEDIVNQPLAPPPGQFSWDQAFAGTNYVPVCTSGADSSGNTDQLSPIVITKDPSSVTVALRDGGSESGPVRVGCLGGAVK